jgi:hypothetical protein
LIANAQTTPDAGDTISNTATATYTDDEGNVINAESNTVVVTVAEVAGITIVPNGVDDSNGGSYDTGDTVTFKFRVTNTGNDSTHIAIPTEATLENAAYLKGLSVTAADVSLVVKNSAGTDITANFTAVTVNEAYQRTNALIASDDYIDVEITSKITATSIVDEISVQLGDVDPNDNTDGTQNQQFTTDNTKFNVNGAGDDIDIANNVITANENADGNDVFTVDGSDTTAPLDDADGAPVNGEREAAAYRLIVLGTEDTPLALAKIKKTGAATSTGATTAITDDEVTFNLSLTVDNNSSTYTPADLEPTDIKLANTTVQRVLVADVVPESTTLKEKPIAPAGWKVVYSTNTVGDGTGGTTIPVILDAEATYTAANWIDWDTNAPGTLANVKRVGFILDPASTDYSAEAGEIDISESITGFSFTVVTTGLSNTNTTIYNIAQVFGKSEGGNDDVVYDESGDDNANNSNDTDDVPVIYDPITNTGQPDPDRVDGDGDPEDNVDPGNNTGTGPEGEVVKVVVIPESNSGLFNGPDGAAKATGPNNNNDDFTNASLAISAGNVISTDPDDPGDLTGLTEAQRTINFTNSIDVLDSVTRVDNVTLQPLSPTEAYQALDLSDDGTDNDSNLTGIYGADADLPNGTKVVIKYDANGDGDFDDTGEKATYTYDGAGNYATTDTPINVGTIEGTDPIVDYEVDIILPTDATVVTGYSVPIVAFSNTDAAGYDDEVVNNITINRAYAGFMTLLKEARILDSDGTTEIETWSKTPTNDIKSGQYIEYRITYKNISTTDGIDSNVLLNANDFTIIEDGNATPNNWSNSTSHVNGFTEVDQIGTGSTVNYFTTYTNATTNTGQTTTDPATGTAIEAYTNVVTIVEPAQQGTFTFRRQINGGE